MDAKKIGIIALAVVALGLLAFSFKQNFLGGPAPASQAAGQEMGRQMQEAARRNRESGGQSGSSGGPGVGTSGPARPPGAGGPPSGAPAPR